MKYSIITCTDGNNVVRAEGITDFESAKNHSTIGASF